MIRSISVFAVLAIAIAVHGEAELKGTPDELTAYLVQQTPPVGLAGTGEVKAEADRAVLRFRVSVNKDSLRDALEAERRLRVEIEAYLTQQEIPAGDIHMSQFASVPQSGWFGKKTASYDVQNTLRVTVTSPQQVEHAAGIVEKFKDVHFVSLTLENSQQDRLKLDAIAKATADLAQKREAYEKGLGVKLVPVSFAVSGEPTPLTLARTRKSGAYDLSSVQAEAAVAETPAVPFGEVVLTARIEAQYRVAAVE
jgi:uncharacterized protein YggE